MTRIPRAPFLLGAIILGAVGITTSLALLHGGYFTSDGFHYFSALRNMAFFQSLHEGPTFEYLLGNHSYVTMYALVPLVRLCPSPETLATLSVLSHFATAYLLYFIASHLLRQNQGTWIPELAGTLYLLSPGVVASFFSGDYMFQPDMLFPPLLCVFFLSLVLARERLLMLSTSLIVLLKEEYILFLPVFTAAFVCCLNAELRSNISKRLMGKGSAAYCLSLPRFDGHEDGRNKRPSDDHK